jgi:probable F420-dependent oxidoreductase
VQVGIHVPQWGGAATRDGVLEVARAAEDAGLASVWVADHLAVPLTEAGSYPYTSDGPPFDASDGFLEALTTLAFAAGVTERVAIGTSVLVLPMREPVSTAKAIATLDVLSEGRMILGVGAGWWKEEFRAVDARFDARGRRLDEQIAILQALWRDGIAEHHGEFYDFDPIASLPRPVQRGGPPIWIGGDSRLGRERAAKLGDSWHAVGSYGARLRDGHAEVRRLAAECGRDRDVALTTSCVLPADAGHAVRRLSRLAALGVEHVVVQLPARTTAEMREAIDRLVGSVIPAVERELTSLGDEDLRDMRAAHG